MAFLKLSDEFLVLGEKRLALYDGYAARTSEKGNSGGSVKNSTATGKAERERE